ncbi:hypothetical protein ACKWTF_003881 [Chironomus riparius]
MIPSFLILIILSVCQLTLQASPFSLQPAVDALNDREAQLALRDEIENGIVGDFAGNDEFEPSNDYDLERGQHIPNKALARYLARSNADYDENFLDYKKRPMLRKRDPSVFRERTRMPTYRQQQAELSERFLKAIEEERERERAEDYREQLKDLWNRYQKEEDNMEKELFNENGNDVETDYAVNFEDPSRKKKRQRGEAEIAPSNWNDKRSMPLLPWLPAQRKKRFPVTKRSPKMNESEMARVVAETSDKVSKDLQGIFGGVVDSKAMQEDDKKKKKRSSDEMMSQMHPEKEHGEKVEKEKVSPASVHHDDMNKKKRIVKRYDDSGEEEETSEEVDEREEPGSEENDDEDDSKKKRKKKREVKKSLDDWEVQAFPDKKSLKKKSVEWSSLFGYDRKKKSMMYNPFRYADQEDRRRKRYESDDDEDEDYHEGDENDSDDTDDDKRKKKRSPGEERLNAMDRKLKTIENLIIEDTAKMYRHQNENLNPSEAKQSQKEIADRLATAYSLEKMRKAIAKLKASMEFQKGLEENLLGKDDEDDEEAKKRKAKRVAIKKEKAEFDNNEHEIESPMKKTNDEDKNNIDDDNDDKKKKKKKRSQKRNNEISAEPLMSEGYMGGMGMMYQRECPMLDSIERRCREVGILSGDSHQNLLEACGEHQLCYLCGDSRAQCDYKYQFDSNEICGYNSKCKINAERSMEALRSFPGMKVGPRECIRDPCLYSALRSIEN